MEFEKAYRSLNTEQREAVDCIDGPLLVIAGPGTGKTQLLSLRVANILRKTDTAPENILCLTFTETGARNMRDRLMSLMGAEGQKVNIATYHAFGALMLQEQRPDMESAVDELDQFMMIREIQKSLKHDDLLKGERHTKDIISTISDIKSALLSVADLRKIVDRNTIDNAKIDTALESVINEIPKGARFNVAVPYYQQVLECLLTFTGEKSVVGKVEPVANIYAITLGEIIREEGAKDKPSASPLSKWREKFFSKDKNDLWRLDNVVANKKLLSLANIMEQYEARLKLMGKFDYDDMILSATQLLENNADFKFNAQEHYQYIMLDEFQDTNDAQAHLVELLTDNPANDGKPNIMAVGDDDQAIYGFQGARSSNFLDFDALYHPKVITLTKNYRSSAPILEFAHNVIEQASDRFSKAQNIEKIISAEKNIADTTICHREFKSAPAEYAWVAEQVDKLLADKISGSEIAIITPKHKYLESIMPYLKRLGIPVSYQKRENILEDPEISRLLAFAQLILALAKDFKAADPFWFRILSFDCWGLETKDIVGEIAAAKKNKQSIAEQLLKSEIPAVQNVITFAIELAGKIQDFSAEYIINEIIIKCLKDANQYNLLTNLTVLRDMAKNKNKAASEKLLLSDFMNLLAAYQAAEIQILNRSPYQESADAVQLLTVHSAKGLEFEHVFMIAADDQNWGNAKGNTNKLSLPRNMEYVRHTGGSLDEKVRVFFVAITRTKARLYLTSSTSDFLGKQSNRLKFLNEREIKDAGNVITFVGDVIPEKYAVVARDEKEDVAAEDLSLNWFSKFVPNAETEKALLKPAVEHYKISPTHLLDYIDLDYAGPEEFLRRHIYKLPQEGGFSLSYGTLIHEVMQAMVDKKLSDEKLLELFAEKVQETDTDEDERAELLEKGRDNLSAYFAVRGDELRRVKAVAEKSFYAENILVDDTPITGKIDRIEIDEVNKTISVVDFKTGSPKEKWANNDVSLKYKIQLYFYKFLLEGSRDYRNYKITSGRIEFVKPTDHEEIVALELQFADKDAAWIKSLIKVVYAKVKALEFEDIEGFKKNYAPTKAFIESLIEGKI
ncbi:MAG: ATP-dependent helicase [Candidatus Nomurabacteria bacterium]|jgi:DNA helicase-2/ATP-dependent DNA helicase PcrA|nr:ATP-dependent helicase [Candidatus Nomurabacteria bacterium]